MKKIKMLIAAAALIASPVLLAPSVGAVDVFDEQCKGNSSNVICENKGDDIGGIVKNIVNALLFIVGILSAIMLIYGGLRYTASGGSPASVKAAKDTILYSIVGLVVAFSAFAIVNWVMDEVVKPPAADSDDDVTLVQRIDV